MNSLVARLPGFVAALWWGSLGTIGFLVVPLLFKNLPTPAMAGGMAARLFTAQTWVSLGCAMLLLMVSRSARLPEVGARVHAALPFVLLGLLLALLGEFGVAPRIVARDNLPLWHAVGSGMYLLQWVCAAVVLWRVLQQPRPEAS
ncbi:DUF4149 domain-containing protein [Variovorax robiniae]|uniref:DUF4149 domain-containing protein n=1 Tax=Variovorax robiniae TaxID=1836199 RepID=A0ABU8X9A9_9BURK